MLESVIYAENTFVAVGDEGTIITSIDGILWTSRTSSTPANLKEVTYGNNMFVTVGASGTILTSSDGIDWTEITSGSTFTLNGVTAIREDSC